MGCMSFKNNIKSKMCKENKRRVKVLLKFRSKTLITQVSNFVCNDSKSECFVHPTKTPQIYQQCISGKPPHGERSISLRGRCERAASETLTETCSKRAPLHGFYSFNIDYNFPSDYSFRFWFFISCCPIKHRDLVCVCVCRSNWNEPILPGLGMGGGREICVRIANYCVWREKCARDTPAGRCAKYLFHCLVVMEPFQRVANWGVKENRSGGGAFFGEGFPGQIY